MDVKHASALKALPTILFQATLNAARHIAIDTKKTLILMTLTGLGIYHIIYCGAIAQA